MRLNSFRTRRRASGFMFWTVSSKTFAKPMSEGTGVCVVVYEDVEGRERSACRRPPLTSMLGEPTIFAAIFFAPSLKPSSPFVSSAILQTDDNNQRQTVGDNRGNASYLRQSCSSLSSWSCSIICLMNALASWAIAGSPSASARQPCASACLSPFMMASRCSAWS